MSKIFEYTNYRMYLKDKYEELKSESSSFSYRYFAMKCGYKSPNFLKLVMNGERNLSIESIATFSKFFKLGKREASYFKKLVLFNQSTSALEREELAKEIIQSTVFQKLHPVSKDHFEYYSHWYYVAVREVLATKKIKHDANSISRILVPTVSEMDVKKSLECLERLGMIKKKNNYFVQDHSLISTGDEISSSSIAKFHREMFTLASESIDRVERGKRDISSVTVSLSSEGVKELKLMIQKFRKDILALSTNEKDPQVVYHMAIQMFPLSKEND